MTKTLKEGALLKVKMVAYFKEGRTKEWMQLSEGETVLCLGIRSYRNVVTGDCIEKFIGLVGEKPFEWNVNCGSGTRVSRDFYRMMYHHFDVLSS